MSLCTSWRRLALSLLFIALAAPISAACAADEFKPLFDGKSLNDWDGNPDFWSVQDGAIVGQTTAAKPTSGNTFLIYRGGDVGNFELQLQFKIEGGNSGIQYRSKEVEGNKWVIGGYQADFDGDNGWTGTLYEERGRGILAKRGSKVEVSADGKIGSTGKTAEEKEIVDSVKKGDWNDYTIIADGNHLVQKVNGVTTVDIVDHEASKAAKSGLLALQLHAGPPMKVQFKNIRIKQLGDSKPEAKTGAISAKQYFVAAQGDSAKKKKIIFLAGGPSHGFGAHDHLSGCKMLAAAIEKGTGYATEVHYKDWPKDVSAYDGADCVVMYSDGGGGHPVNSMLSTMDQVAKKGTGIICIHYAVETTKGESGDKFLDWIGGYFEPHYSVNPHWVAKFEKFPDHPICNGVKPFETDDEWYYHMRFRPEMKGVTPILTALPPASTLTRGDGPHSGNPDVRRDVLEKKEPQHMAWAAVRENDGRGFGFTGAHNHWNWGQDDFRKLVLNAIVWCAHGEVPKDGVGGGTITVEDLLKNPDEEVPGNFNKEEIAKQFHIKAASNSGDKPGAEKPASGPAAKPLYASKVVTTQNNGHAVEISVDLKDAKQLYLVVTDGGNGFGCDWADWCEPRLIGDKGELKLTELKWKSAVSGFGAPQMNKNCEGRPLKVNNEAVSYGIGTHANSVIAFDIPEGYTRFKARGGIDNDGSGQQQGTSSSVEFMVFSSKPPASLTAGTNAGGGGGAAAVSRDPADAVAGLDVAEGLEAELFSSEPDISNITSIDIDHLGRIWACEVKNYRRWNNSRPEGDRILVLEDTNGDNKADKTTVFYQGRDIDSAHGICVLGNRVIVSAGDKVQSFYDDNNDLKSDRKETLFSGIGGVQHDHGIHAFCFGPDGKLYFNFGNEGHQLKDKDGKPVIDQAGNEINAGGKPYRQGMVFRCDLDGSNIETLGWNFRNNWEATIDSFGTIWQSDNDDDGNKGVRINYVMEFGNYGYTDEMTGAGWQQKRENMEAEIPLRHWHLNDPGVVPNLIQTGAGSPTGIVLYEGNLLPEMFRNQVIHCDAGPNVCRAYIAKKDGAGYSAEMENVLFGARDNWFRPSDVCTASDGSLFVADWYDPGVGGHNQQEVDKGRIFRVAPPGSKYAPPKFDFAKIEDCIEALKNPNLSVRYMAFTSLQKRGHDAESAIETLIEKTQDARVKARAIWLLGKLDGEGDEAVELAVKDGNPDIRIAGIRLARELKMDVTKLKLADDSAPEVRRELAIALRESKSADAPKVWAQLASRYDGKDRWYLEALGIGAGANWDACLSAYMDKVGDKWNTPAGHDVIWRSRGKQTPALLAKILLDEKTKPEEQARYMRAFDFLSGPEKDAALKSILE